jgi:hypothetical protein
MTAQLRTWRAGVVLDKKTLRHAQSLCVGLDTHHVGYGAYAGDHGRDIVDLHIHIRRIGRGRLEIRGALVIDADEMHPRIRRINRVMALAIGLGMRDFLHALIECVVPLVTVPVMVAAEAPAANTSIAQSARVLRGIGFGLILIFL